MQCILETKSKMEKVIIITLQQLHILLLYIQGWYTIIRTVHPLNTKFNYIIKNNSE